MIIYVSVDEPVMPDWIYKKGLSDEGLLEVWCVRAEIHKEILDVEYLPAPSPWKVQYRMVNCSGTVYELH